MFRKHTSLFDAWMAAANDAFATATGQRPQGQIISRLSDKICSAYDQLTQAARADTGFDIKSDRALQIVEKILPKNIRQETPRDENLQIARAVLTGFEQARTGSFELNPFPKPPSAAQTREDILKTLKSLPPALRPAG